MFRFETGISAESLRTLAPFFHTKAEKRLKDLVFEILAPFDTRVNRILGITVPYIVRKMEESCHIRAPPFGKDGLEVFFYAPLFQAFCGFFTSMELSRAMALMHLKPYPLLSSWGCRRANRLEKSPLRLVHRHHTTSAHGIKWQGM